MKNLRIVYMGTPDFAVAPLGSLLMNGFNIAGVVTSPDKPAGRGMKIGISPVKKFAQSNMLQLYQPENLKSPDFIAALEKLEPDIFIVVAFRMLPEVVWSIPEMGTINLHASLLPHYRGAAPVNHALINGESVTGVTTFLIDDKIDTGKILMREEVQIFPCDNAGDLRDRLMKHGARLIISTITAMAEDRIMPRPQSDFILPGEILKPAPKIYPSGFIIDWHKDAVTIHNLVRGLAPQPGARFTLKNSSSERVIKVLESLPEEKEHTLEHGQIITDGKEYLKIACRNGFVSILNLQPEGRKIMSTRDFLRGCKINDYHTRIS
ncbi:MAG TPA: methionyl-tRNA formyltransferase [Bacteroidales bacterium]|nr:methionyl-tRNA formyltransferase [Bacteroidales bacterium]